MADVRLCEDGDIASRVHIAAIDLEASTVMVQCIVRQPGLHTVRIESNMLKRLRRNRVLSRHLYYLNMSDTMSDRDAPEM